MTGLTDDDGRLAQCRKPLAPMKAGRMSSSEWWAEMWVGRRWDERGDAMNGLIEGAALK